MWTSESLKKRNNKEKKISTNAVKITRTVLDRMNHLNIDASLKLSFLGGLGKSTARFMKGFNIQKKCIHCRKLFGFFQKLLMFRCGC